MVVRASGLSDSQSPSGCTIVIAGDFNSELEIWLSRTDALADAVLCEKLRLLQPSTEVDVSCDGLRGEYVLLQRSAGCRLLK